MKYYSVLTFADMVVNGKALSNLKIKCCYDCMITDPCGRAAYGVGCGRSIADRGQNPVEGMGIRLLCLLCVVLAEASWAGGSTERKSEKHTLDVILFYIMLLIA